MDDLSNDTGPFIRMTNASLDSFVDQCFKEFNKIACARDAIEAIIALVTAVLCLVKIIKLHLAKHELWNQYLIFYAAIAEIILLTLNWMYVHHAELDLVAELLKLFQFLVVCWFYSEIAARMSKKENIYKRILLPCLVLTSTYFVVLILVGILNMKDNIDECSEPEWIQLSCSEVVLGIVFMVVGIYITKQTNKLKTDDLRKRNVKRSLWGIISSFEVSALISAAYDILMIFIGEDFHCKGLFVYDAAAFTTTHVIVKIMKWLLPIWAMMLTFKPDSFKGSSDKENDSDQPPIVQRSHTGVFKSEFRPRERSFNYKHLREPQNENERKLLTTPHAPVDHEIKRKKKKYIRRHSHKKSEGSSTSGEVSSTSASPQKKSPVGSNSTHKKGTTNALLSPHKNDVLVSINPGPPNRVNQLQNV